MQFSEAMDSSAQAVASPVTNHENNWPWRQPSRFRSSGVISRLLVSLLVMLCLALNGEPAIAAAPAHHVVIEVGTVSSDGWAQVLGSVRQLLATFGQGKIEIEVVTHGPGIGLLVKKDAEFAAPLQELAERGVSFMACQQTMTTSRLLQKDLFPFVKIVDSGVAEVVRRQEQGWSYLKGGY